ncbi:hypothetical protein BO86DRAFT_37699 [Aspergillus japonicus CBS 114.51]|uniref:Transmembrane protein n=1 Tax=Aspergillus japonicus CBS 114.51 TaxID=1448312 RepID=A0A8T8WJV8_ASPJA|nr:hypothetical protein BO86DRAFT_37699 [Aspergillus japonicus CBS 114.51]RAH75993.1 hypothetical protein BO86DRAFT_37699 [Aspergillus japonicus CBS 114.51]
MRGYNFDRIPSNRNFTSFRTLLEGFHSSNWWSSSRVSVVSSRRTYSSSRRPRMAKGRMYGFAGDGGCVRLMSRRVLVVAVVVRGRAVVWRANWMARLFCFFSRGLVRLFAYFICCLGGGRDSSTGGEERTGRRRGRRRGGSGLPRCRDCRLMGS